jgi:outer membrane receptor protein involved in Fe transport
MEPCFNNQLFGNTTAVFNNYNFAFQAEQNNFNIKLASGIRDFSLKQDFDFYPFTGHKLKFGGIYTYHRFTPNVVSGNQDSVVFQPVNAQPKFAHEAALYIQDDWEISDKVKINADMRYSGFNRSVPLNIYQTDDNGNRLDSTVFKRDRQ